MEITVLKFDHINLTALFIFLQNTYFILFLLIHFSITKETKNKNKRPNFKVNLYKQAFSLNLLTFLEDKNIYNKI